MLNPKQKYLQIALNSTLYDAESIIRQIPLDNRIIIEAGTPLIKNYGVEGIRRIGYLWMQKIFDQNIQSFEVGESAPFWIKSLIGAIEKSQMQKQKKVLKGKERDFFPYIVADLKCMDRGGAEVEIAKAGGASAVTCLGHAPIETIDAFIEDCERLGLDPMVDMINVEFPLAVLRKLKKQPTVVILHRGVDEEHFNPEREIPFHEIQRIKGFYDIMIAIAGGDTIQDIQRALFNDADIAVVWKPFYHSSADTAKLAEDFLRDIR